MNYKKKPIFASTNQLKISQMIKSFSRKLQNILEIGKELLGTKIHLSRKKFILSYVTALCMSRSVQSKDVGFYLNQDVKVDSNVRRIERFFESYELDYVLIAIILINFIPEKKYRICIDRTNWQFGKLDINIFALTIYYKGTSIPILFDMLAKKGNSNQEERVKLISRFIDIFGYKCIRSITADREFIGQKWMSFLIEKGIDFQIRIPKNILINYEGSVKSGDELLIIHGKAFLKNILIKEMPLHLAMDCSTNNKGEDDPLLVVTNDKNCDALTIYKERWSIEVFFQNLKGRGFNLENTHINKIDRVGKLFSMTCIAFAMCLTIGVYTDVVEKGILIKNNGYRKNSYFRHGLDILKEELLKQNSLQVRINEFAEIIIGFLNSIFENLIKKRIIFRP